MCTGGRVVAIYTAVQAGSPMQSRRQVRAVSGRGLEGDRYFASNGSFAGSAVPGREVTELTLIEGEVIDHLRAEWGLDVTEGESRRNLVTRGVALNDLIGGEFYVGNVRLRGAGLCEPCVSLVKTRDNMHLLRALVHRGGLRAQIVSGGWIAVGDRIGGAVWRDSMDEAASPTR